MNYHQKLEDLVQEGFIAVFELIKSKGVECKYSHEKCLQICLEAYQFNFKQGEYLTEITSDNLISNTGYQYSLFHFSTDKLCQLIDHLIETYNN